MSVKKPSKETVTGIFVIIGLLSIVYLSVNLGNLPIFSGGAYTLYAHFRTISGLEPGNNVEMFGFKVGSVVGFSIDEDEQVVIAKLKINRGIKVHADAVAMIETNGLIGEKYVDIETQGKGKILQKGDLIKTGVSSLNELAETVKELPYKQISDELLSTLTGLDRIVNSPILQENLVNLNEILKDIRKLVQHADTSIGGIVAGFEKVESDLRTVLGNIDAKIDPLASEFKAVSTAARKTLMQAEKTLSLKEGRSAQLATSIKEAADAVGSAAREAKRAFIQADQAFSNIDSLTADDSTEVYELRNALKELSAAARSIKQFADYIDRHPEALLRGKGDGFTR